MKFFVDTANLDQIREAHAMGVLDGVTTNPSLMARANPSSLIRLPRATFITMALGFMSENWW